MIRFPISLDVQHSPLSFISLVLSTFLFPPLQISNDSEGGGAGGTSLVPNCPCGGHNFTGVKSCGDITVNLRSLERLISECLQSGKRLKGSREN